MRGLERRNRLGPIVDHGEAGNLGAGQFDATSETLACASPQG
jgi:hypothetical protein